MATPKAGGNISRDDFSYSTERLMIPAGGSVTTSINIEADSDFEIMKRMVFSSSHDSYNIPIAVQITDTGSGRDLFNTPTAIANVFGSAQLPFILQQTKIFSARSVISITLTNFSPSADVENAQLTFGGRKIFNARQY